VLLLLEVTCPTKVLDEVRCTDQGA
jgi:hypothetical protein